MTACCPRGTETKSDSVREENSAGFRIKSRNFVHQAILNIVEDILMVDVVGTVTL